MGVNVVNGALLQCSFGLAPSPLTVLPTNRVMVSNMPAANIMDHLPMVNIKPFGMCTSLSNPMVVAATAAALGVLTPMPCLPVTATPWVPAAPTTLIGTAPALVTGAVTTCAYAGVIQIINPGATTVLSS